MSSGELPRPCSIRGNSYGLEETADTETAAGAAQSTVIMSSAGGSDRLPRPRPVSVRGTSYAVEEMARTSISTDTDTATGPAQFIRKQLPGRFGEVTEEPKERTSLGLADLKKTAAVARKESGLSTSSGSADGSSQLRRQGSDEGKTNSSRYRKQGSNLSDSSQFKRQGTASGRATITKNQRSSRLLDPLGRDDLEDLEDSLHFGTATALPRISSSSNSRNSRSIQGSHSSSPRIIEDDAESIASTGSEFDPWDACSTLENLQKQGPSSGKLAAKGSPGGLVEKSSQKGKSRAEQMWWNKSPSFFGMPSRPSATSRTSDSSTLGSTALAGYGKKYQVDQSVNLSQARDSFRGQGGRRHKKTPRMSRMGVFEHISLSISGRGASTFEEHQRKLDLIGYKQRRDNPSIGKCVGLLIGAGLAGGIFLVLSLVLQRSTEKPAAPEASLQAVTNASVPIVDADDGLDHDGAPSVIVKSTDKPFTDPEYDAQEWVFGILNVLPVWEQGLTGEGIMIQVVDSGVDDTHPEFAGRFNKTASCEMYLPDLPCEEERCSHGTSCASIAAAGGNNDECAVGIAPDASLSSCRYDADNAAVDAFAKAVEINADISTNSWNNAACIDLSGATRRELQDELCPLAEGDKPRPAFLSDACYTRMAKYCYSKFLTDPRCKKWLPYYAKCTYSKLSDEKSAALERAIKEGRNGLGLIIVFAAGNDRWTGATVNMDGWVSSRYTIAVGAVGKDKKHASYSTTGAGGLFISAPGGDDESPTNHMAAKVGGGCHDAGTGTSFATPTVAGALALVLQANPKLGWRDVQGILAETAQKVYSADKSWTTNAAGYHHSRKYGFGVMDTAAAVEAAKTWKNYGVEIMYSKEEQGLFLQIGNEGIPVSTKLKVTAENMVTESVVIQLNVTHVPRGNLQVKLASPQGTVTELMPSGRHETTLVDEEWELLSVRTWGEDPSGTWTLTVVDNVGGNLAGSTANRSSFIGTLDGWKLTIYGHKRDDSVQTAIKKQLKNHSATQSDAYSVTSATKPLATSQDPMEHLSLAARERWTDLVGLITRNNLTSTEEFDDPTSSAYKALDWFLEYNTVIEYSSSDTHTQLLENYALMVFYFATHPNAQPQDAKTFALHNSKNAHHSHDPNTDWIHQGNTPVCHWQGVHCGHLKRVVVLNLTQQQLQGTLANELQALEHLIDLDLSENDIGGTLPRVWGETLDHLKVVNLANNQLQGTFPWKNQLTKLESLNLSGNAIEGPIPELNGS